MPSLADQISAQVYTQKEAMLALEKRRPNLDVKDFVQARADLEKTEELVIISALPLGDREIQRLGEKARNLLKRNIFIDIKVDFNLIGGAAFAWKGQYKDYSLRAKFADNSDTLRGIYEQFIQERRSRLR